MSGASVLATITIDVGTHITRKFLGLTMNVDTLWSTAVALVIMLALAVAMRVQLTSGVPGKLQLMWEFVVGSVRNQVEQSIGPDAGPVVPLALTLGVFILIASWLEVIPGYPLRYVPGGSKPGLRAEYLIAPTSDVNLVYAMAIVVFAVYTVASFRANGIRGYFRRFVKPYKALLLVNVVEEIAKPLTLALRLFGNVFSGGLMITLLALLPAYLTWAPTTVWKLFDMFIFAVQAFIFSLLTILYYGAAVSAEPH